MVKTLQEDIYAPHDLYHRKKGMQVEVLQTGLFRNELNTVDYSWFKVEQVKIKYPYFSWTFKDGRTETVYNVCEVDAKILQ